MPLERPRGLFSKALPAEGRLGFARPVSRWAVELSLVPLPALRVAALALRSG